MIGGKYKVKEDCVCERIQLKKGEILTEKEAYNFEIEEYEDASQFSKEEAGYNELRHDKYGFICDVGSKWAKENLEMVLE